MTSCSETVRNFETMMKVKLIFHPWEYIILYAGQYIYIALHGLF